MDWLTEFPELGRRDLRDFRKGIDESFKSFTRTYGEAIESFFDPLLQFLIWLERLLLATPWPLHERGGCGGSEFFLRAGGLAEGSTTVVH